MFKSVHRSYNSATCTGFLSPYYIFKLWRGMFLHTGRSECVTGGCRPSHREWPGGGDSEAWEEGRSGSGSSRRSSGGSTWAERRCCAGWLARNRQKAGRAGGLGSRPGGRLEGLHWGPADWDQLEGGRAAGSLWADFGCLECHSRWVVSLGEILRGSLREVMAALWNHTRSFQAFTVQTVMFVIILAVL